MTSAASRACISRGVIRCDGGDDDGGTGVMIEEKAANASDPDGGGFVAGESAGGTGVTAVAGNGVACGGGTGVAAAPGG